MQVTPFSLSLNSVIQLLCLQQSTALVVQLGSELVILASYGIVLSVQACDRLARAQSQLERSSTLDLLLEIFHLRIGFVDGLLELEV